MDMINSDEALRLRVIHLLSEKLPKNAILKGGMVLRILDCPRNTNDLDYVFIPFKSKKKIVPLMQNIFSAYEGVKLEVGLHSTSARFKLYLKNKNGNYKTQIEINVAKECEYEAVATSQVSIRYHQVSHVVKVMRNDIAFANKLSAWVERRLMRDAYDIYFFFKILGEMPNRKTLENRLKKLNFARRLRQSSLPKKMSFEEFLKFFEQTVDQVTAEEIKSELHAVLDPIQLPGLEKKIKIAMREMIERLK
ncbi:MAG: nucleotidyl transferase AbiEii/AbiGii toxin family protein [Deltaproteobacteria bacterium]|nr:nucleotidyl transferase AbiEii/AbiGii toxin family protein [Deltaproteobacteria bacterium]